MKRILLALLAAAMVVASGTTAFAHRGHDDGGKAKERVFTLAPDPTSSPEGIDFDKRTRSFYVSITGLSPATSGGDIYRGTLGSDKVEPFIAGGAGKNAVGVEVHRGKLYVAGGPSGAITVYDLEDQAGGRHVPDRRRRLPERPRRDAARRRLRHGLAAADAVARDRRPGEGRRRHAAGARRVRRHHLRGGVQPQRHRRQGLAPPRGGADQRRQAVPDRPQRRRRRDRRDRRDRGRQPGGRRDDPRPRPARRGHRQPGAAELRQARATARRGRSCAARRRATSCTARRPSRARRTSTSW